MYRVYKKYVFLLLVFLFLSAWVTVFSGFVISPSRSLSEHKENVIQEEHGQEEEETTIAYGLTDRSLYTEQPSNLSTDNIDIIPPSIFYHLPYLKEHSLDALKPSFKISRGRTAVSVVLGIPSVKRHKKSYLLQTLKSLISNLSFEQRNNCLIVVFIAEPFDLSYVHSQAAKIINIFRNEIETGLLEIVSPPSKFYPNFTTITSNLGDTKERTVWRTKQNLDYCYLMMYIHRRGQYYLQLEDDVITKPNYITNIINFAKSQKPNWFVLEFSQLGFIGKFFKTSDLQYLIQFIAKFHLYQPCDWLVDHYLLTRACRLNEDKNLCTTKISEIRIRYKFSLFQHIGIHSSLKGKLQMLKDTDFRRVQLRWPIYPTADRETTLHIYVYFFYFCLITIYITLQLC